MTSKKFQNILFFSHRSRIDENRIGFARIEVLSHELLQVPVHDDVDFVGTDARCAEPAHENVRRLREADVALGEPLDDFFGLAVALEVARRKRE